ncbi:MAG TPA: hypothetical protein PKK26_02930 [Candidatus Wallbacteria bacterium]|nr:hypothetical protein [Candidatus Wallbacteria bacterium]
MKFYRLLLLSVVMIVIFTSVAFAADGKSGRISIAGTNYNIEYKNAQSALNDFQKMVGHVETMMKNKKINDKDRKYLIDAFDIELDTANESASEISALQKQIEDQKTNLMGLKVKVDMLIKKLSTYTGKHPKNFKKTPRPAAIKNPGEFADESIKKLYEAVNVLNDIDYAINNFMIDRKAKPQIEAELKNQSTNISVLLETVRVKNAEIETGTKNITIIRVKLAELLQNLTNYQPPKKERDEYKPKMLKK